MSLPKLAPSTTPTLEFREGNIVSTEEKRLTLAYENLTSIPPNLLMDYAPILEILDLSHNQISNVNFLSNCKKLTTLILDHNIISSDTTFPYVPSLQTLWLNHNRINNLHPFIQRVSLSFENLRCLSLMGNEGAPSYLTGGTYYEYLQYRLFVISSMDKLEYLDDRKVTLDQRKEARRLYGRSFGRLLKNFRSFNLNLGQSPGHYLEMVQRRFMHLLEGSSDHETVARWTRTSTRDQISLNNVDIRVQDMGNVSSDSSGENTNVNISYTKKARNLVI